MRALHRRQRPHEHLVNVLAVLALAVLATGVAKEVVPRVSVTVRWTSGHGTRVSSARPAPPLFPPSTTAPATAPPTSDPTPPAGSTTSSPATTPPTPTTAPGSPPSTYVVKPGDTLGKIAEWFSLQGYSGLYQQNRAVIGENPDLLHPGEHITISDGTVSVTAP